MNINCDTGERGLNLIDIELVKIVDEVNVACGGHAGDEKTIRFYCELAIKHNTKINAHISYPDKENFGRHRMDISDEDLIKSINEQYNNISKYTKSVKFHGALYNVACSDANIGKLLAQWCVDTGITSVVTLYDGQLSIYCKMYGINVVGEFFAERNYTLSKNGSAVLVDRKNLYASIHNVNAAIAHSKYFISDKKVNAVIPFGDGFKYEQVPVVADTICIHSDSEIALPLAKELRKVLK